MGEPSSKSVTALSGRAGGMLAIALIWLALPLGAATTDLTFAGFTISVSDSWTAQVFHIVDQLSEWDQYAHKQYGRWASTSLALTDGDTELLRKHAALRRVRGWGKGFEQAFLVEGSIEDAASRAIDIGVLSREEAVAERDILLHFSLRLAGLRDQQRDVVAAFKQRLVTEQSQMRPTVEGLVRFAELREPVTFPVFLVSNPDTGSGGGEANGGRLVVEVPGGDSMGILLHESLHALLKAHEGEIATAARSVGLSFNALNEGIAYAMAPGLTDDPSRTDRLGQYLARALQRGTAATDPYAQSYMVAAVIRPTLRAALQNDETFTQFLPKAVGQWRSFAGR